MGVLGSLAKVGLAKKVFDEARKPKNQRKLRQLWSRATRRRNSNPAGEGPSRTAE